LDELNVFNAAEIFAFSGIHGAAKLRSRAMEIITENLDRVEDTPGFNFTNILLAAFKRSCKKRKNTVKSFLQFWDLCV
jgi:hypothetical protein